MVLAELLEWAGFGGSAVIVGSVAVALYHGRNVLALLSTIGFATKIVGGLLFVLTLAWAGLIPGIEVGVQVGRLASLLNGVADVTGDLVGGLLLTDDPTMGEVAFRTGGEI